MAAGKLAGCQVARVGKHKPMAAHELFARRREMYLVGRCRVNLHHRAFTGQPETQIWTKPRTRARDAAWDHGFLFKLSAVSFSVQRPGHFWLNFLSIWAQRSERGHASKQDETKLSKQLRFGVFFF